MTNRALSLLFSYQETRRRLLTLKEKIAGLGSASNMGVIKKRLQKISNEVASCEGAISLLKRKIKKVEDNCSDLAEHRRQSETALYGGKVSSPKELAQLERKINEYKEIESKNEDQILHDLLALEKKEAELEELLQSKNKLGQELEKVKEHLLKEKNALSKEINMLEKETENLEGLLPAKLKERFERMAPKIHGAVIVPVKDGICEGCHMLLSPAMKEQLRAREERDDQPLFTCENCGRIIFIP